MTETFEDFHKVSPTCSSNLWLTFSPVFLSPPHCTQASIPNSSVVWGGFPVLYFFSIVIFFDCPVPVCIISSTWVPPTLLSLVSSDVTFCQGPF